MYKVCKERIYSNGKFYISPFVDDAILRNEKCFGIKIKNKNVPKTNLSEEEKTTLVKQKIIRVKSLIKCGGYHTLCMLPVWTDEKEELCMPCDLNDLSLGHIKYLVEGNIFSHYRYNSINERVQFDILNIFFPDWYQKINEALGPSSWNTSLLIKDRTLWFYNDYTNKWINTEIKCSKFI